jgi:hypothetical protein
MFKVGACLRRALVDFALKDIHGNSVYKSASWKKLKLVDTSAGYMIQKERRRTGRAIPRNI